jgi:hypothetical protein
MPPTPLGGRAGVRWGEYFSKYVFYRALFLMILPHTRIFTADDSFAFPLSQGCARNFPCQIHFIMQSPVNRFPVSPTTR